MPVKKELKIIDNYNSIKHIISNTKLNSGQNFITKELVGTNKYNPKLKIKFNIGSYNSTKSVLTTYNKNLKQLTYNKKQKPSIILKTIKGGYLTHYSGMIGFLPKSQYKNALQQLKNKQQFFFKN